MIGTAAVAGPQGNFYNTAMAEAFSADPGLRALVEFAEKVAGRYEKGVFLGDEARAAIKAWLGEDVT